MKRAWNIFVEFVKMHTVEATPFWIVVAILSVISGLIVASHYFVAVQIGFACVGVAVILFWLVTTLHTLFYYFREAFQTAVKRVDRK